MVKLYCKALMEETTLYNSASWEHIQQITTVTTTFAQATFVLRTFVHISNISISKLNTFDFSLVYYFLRQIWLRNKAWWWLDSSKIQCTALLYQVIQGYIWHIFSYMCCAQRPKWYFTNLKAIYRWISKMSIYFWSGSHPPQTCLDDTCTLPKDLWIGKAWIKKIGKFGFLVEHCLTLPPS